jgi:hypothetical protein
MCIHTHFSNGIVDRQLEELIVAENTKDLAYEDSQREAEEKHSDAMLSKWDKEVELLERLLIEPESERESTTREETCSEVPSSEGEVLIASKEVKVNFNFQFNLEIAGLAEENEHDMEVASRLFPKDEIRPQLMNFEDELKLLEEWLTKDAGQEDCKRFEDSVQTNFKEKMEMSINKWHNWRQ